MSTNPSISQIPPPGWLRGQSAETTSSTTDDKQASPTNDVLPSIPVPKTSGAIRGMGESIDVDLLSDTSALTVPIRVSPGYSGFAPELSLWYSSNSPFGIGWSLELPSITRKTANAIPQYLDQDESDTFILTDHDDLIPVLEYKGGRWSAKTPVNRMTDGIQYEIRGYCPRTEGLFSRIEKWTAKETGETHWRTISKENTTMLFGTDSNSHIKEPGGRKIFSWLLSSSYDDKGNAVAYQYKLEDPAGFNMGQADEYNSSDETRSVGRYIKRIKYGNITPHLVEPDVSKAAWMFEVVFDYGEHDTANLSSDDQGAAWLCRCHIQQTKRSHI